ncbi:MAG: EF-hand domain-containing protein [Chromatiaceae bacterium]|nr:EF-hand domain-containing protein [Chromatiaceae bacterium]
MIYANRFGFLCLGLMITAAGVPAAAQSVEPPSRGPMTFEAFDMNGDGHVTEQEFQSVRADRMAAQSAQGAPMRGAANAPPFSVFDQNGDGSITPEEFAAAQQTRMQGRPGMGTGAGMGSGMGMGPGMGRGMGQNMPVFADFDLNADATLTKEEFDEARAKRIAERSQQGYPMRNLPNAPTFEDIDTDGDGIVGPEEFAAHQAAHRAQMMQQMPQ